MADRDGRAPARDRFDSARAALDLMAVGDVRSVPAGAYVVAGCWRDVMLVAGAGRDLAAAALALRWLVGLGWAEVADALGVSVRYSQRAAAEALDLLDEGSAL